LTFLVPPPILLIPPFCKEEVMPRYRGSKEAAGTIVGRLLLLVAAGRETSASLAGKLGVSPRQVNRYVLQLADAGWHLERRGTPTRGDYHFELVSPRVVLGGENPRARQGP
jgi:hypothetical protein